MKTLREMMDIVENKIVYGRLTRDNANLIIDKAKNKSDGVYSFRGIMFNVTDGKVTHYAYDNKIMVGYGQVVSQIGGYSTDKEARTILKNIKD